MGKTKILIILFLSLYIQANSQSNFLTRNTSIKASLKNAERIDRPLKEFFFNLDIVGLEDYLENVGSRENIGNTIFKIPTEDGLMKEYKIFEASVLEEEFQADYPNIRSFAGQGITKPEETIRFTITSLGFQAIILGTPNGTQYIKPFDRSRNIYSSYFQKDVFIEDNSFECQLVETPPSTNNDSSPQTSLFNANDGRLRDYRFAVSATSEYSAFYNNNLTDVISAMTIATSNANAVLERDLSITLTMIDNTSLIFFDAATDPFDNFDNIALLDQNQLLIDTNIGDANYDFGHVFNTAGGGVAGLATSCISNFKAWGVTGSFNPDGDRFIFTFLHELGHQFGSPHTFNGDEGGCGPNISIFTAVEPGSGSTIMAYPGICGSQNVQFNGDLYYHQISLETMWNHVTNTGSCPALQTVTGNNAPLASAGPDYLIPQGTPYKLIASSSDPEGTITHTYTWEQYDFGSAGIPTETTITGPVVRSFEGTINNTRYIPRLSDLLSFQGSSDWEKLVTVDRVLNFRVTVRDNDVNGGQTALDAMIATVTTDAGPFIVTSQSLENQIVWIPGTTETITWDVAGTDSNGINESTVNILLSTDAGLTYNTVLASNVTNDGIHDIVVPNLDAAQCRIMVEASNNIFFNINSAFFAIGDYTYQQDCEDINFVFNTPIPENQNSASAFPFEITDPFDITDLNVNLKVNGNADNSSIFFALRPPFDPIGFYELVVYPCNGTTGMDVTLDDEGLALDCNSINNDVNTLPVDPLSFADGQNPQGNWILFGGDINVDGNISTLDSMTFSVCSIQAVPNTLSNMEFEIFKDVLVYPNPGNGLFNLKLNSDSGENILVELYDITGRFLGERIYDNSQTGFETTIDFSQFSSGTYMLKIKQGQNSVVEKIIIK